jgi:hypothetical protein
VYGWIGGDRPSDVLEQAKERKAQGFTAVKMNAVESVIIYTLFSPLFVGDSFFNISLVGSTLRTRLTQPLSVSDRLRALGWMPACNPFFYFSSIFAKLSPGYPGISMDVYTGSSPSSSLRLLSHTDHSSSRSLFYLVSSKS